MNLNYKTIEQLNITEEYLNDWCDSRETSPEVGLAIHAIADKSRTAEQIWDSPTDAEFDHVLMAIDSYVGAGLFEPDTEYCWGAERLRLQ